MLIGWIRRRCKERAPTPTLPRSTGRGGKSGSAHVPSLRDWCGACGCLTCPAGVRILTVLGVGFRRSNAVKRTIGGALVIVLAGGWLAGLLGPAAVDRWPAGALFA